MGSRVAPVAAVRGPTLVDSHSRSTAAEEDSAPVYEIVQSLPLHAIDLSRSVKSELFGATTVAKYNAALRRVWLLIMVCHNVVNLLMPVALVVPPDLGRQLALWMIPLATPGCISVLLSLRYDLLYVLVRTYEFWFFWTTTVVTCVCLAVYVADTRMVVAVFIAVGILISILIDASVSLSRTCSVSSAIAGAVALAVVAVVQLHLVPEVNGLSITYNARTLSLPDIVVNGISTFVLLLSRNAYRRCLTVWCHQGDERFSTQCISYRCTVRLRAVASVASPHPPASRRRPRSRVSSVPRLWSNERMANSWTVSDLRMVPITERFDSRRTLAGVQLPLMANTLAWPILVRWSLPVLGVSTISLTGALYFCEVALDTSLPVPLSVVPLVVACVACTWTGCFMQPQLLRRLWTSFDFLFISLQLTAFYVCVMDSFAWDRRAFMVLTACAWVHLVLMMDALLPITRQRIGFHKALAMFVLTCFAGGELLYLVRLVFSEHWEIDDRVLFDRVVCGRRVRIRVVPMIFSRLPILLCWSLRLLWRLHKSQDGELVMIQGVVSYDSSRRKSHGHSHGAITSPAR